MFDGSWRLHDYFTLLAFLTTVWLYHLIPLLAVAAPIWFFGRRRVKWCVWDFSIVVIPFACWATLMVIHDIGKTLANLVVEAVIIGCIAALAPAARLFIRDKRNQIQLAVILLIGACILATGLWAFVPGLPE